MEALLVWLTIVVLLIGLAIGALVDNIDTNMFFLCNTMKDIQQLLERLIDEEKEEDEDDS